MSTPANDWDAAGNGPIDPRQPRPYQDLIISDDTIGFSGHSGHSGYMSYTTTATIADTTLHVDSSTVHFTPQSTWAYAPSEYIQPIEYTFQTSSWKYVLCYAFSTILSPWLAIWSKLSGRKTGFRYRNIERAS